MNNLLNNMKCAARGAGDIMRGAGTEEIGTKTKSSFRDVVTKYDVMVQEYVIGSLKKAYPDAAFISEEKDEAPDAENGLIFVIDPIDGTANFSHHYQHSCTSIGCVRDQQPIAAVVYDPYLDELFSAEKGKGAFLNEEPLHVPDHSIEESLVLFGSAPYYMDRADETFRNIRTAFDHSQDIRRSGSAALDLCYVAAGRGGLFFESVLSVWDYAAGALIVQEAGGICTDMDGQELICHRPVRSSVIAGSRLTIAGSGLSGSGSQKNPPAREAVSSVDEIVVRQKYEKLTHLLIEKQLSITTMESCTAGQIASLITDTEGSSAILKGAFVTYSNEAKIRQGVSEEVIRTYGVYSEETSRVMAQACRRTYDADLGIGVTGSFGNTDPANSDSVPGEVYYSIAREEGTESCHCTIPVQDSRIAYKLYMANEIVDSLLALLTD